MRRERCGTARSRRFRPALRLPASLTGGLAEEAARQRQRQVEKAEKPYSAAGKKNPYSEYKYRVSAASRH